MNKYVKIIAAAAGGLALLASVAFADPYEPYKGTTLVVSFPTHPHYNVVVSKLLPVFTKETGINVEVDQLEYLKLRDKQALELTKDKGDYDLISYVVFSKTDYVYANQLENLARFFLDPKLADPSYDANDLIAGYVQNIGVVGGEKGYLPGPTGSLYGLPFGAETSALAYRADIFEKHKLKVPTTYDELVEVSCKIKDLEPGMGGVAIRSASGQHASHAYLLGLAPLGGRIFDEKWNPIINNEAGVKAGEVFKKLVSCGPEGARNFGQVEAATAFQQGKSAMFLDSISFAPQFEDASSSQVAGKVGWALHPEGVRRASQSGGFGIAIPHNAPNKEAAFLLMQWLTSKAADKLIAIEGGSPSRFSTHEDAEVLAARPYRKIFGEALKYVDPDWRPIISVWGKINNDLGTTMSKIVVENLDVKAELTALSGRIKTIMQEAGYYSWR